MNSRRLFSIFLPFIILLALYLFVAPKVQVSKNTLTVYTYSSFASSWGAGASLKKAFKEKSGWNVDFIDVGDAGTILQRLDIEKEKTPADLIIGLDPFSLSNAAKKVSFLDHNIQLETHSKVKLPVTNIFLPYNWSPMVFVYRKSDFPIAPKNLKDLVSPSLKSNFVLYDPRSSTPGYIFAHYIFDKMGEASGKKYLSDLKKNVQTITPSWSAGYGLFTQKSVRLAFSYLTSPLYHAIEEKNTDYQALILEEAAPIHIEYAAILKNTSHAEKSREFLNFLVSDEGQEIIMNKNYMLPVKEGVENGTPFEHLKLPELYLFTNSLDRETVLKYWSEVK